MQNNKGENSIMHFKLFIAGRENHSNAVNNLLQLKEECLPENSKIEIIDLLKDPKIAIKERIRVLPQLVRVSPEPVVRIFGDLSDSAKVLHFLGLDIKTT